MEKNQVCWEGGHDELRAGYDDLEVLLLQVGIFSRHISESRNKTNVQQVKNG